MHTKEWLHEQLDLTEYDQVESLDMAVYCECCTLCRSFRIKD